MTYCTYSPQTNESLFPCELSKETLSSVKDAVEVAVKEWGEKSLTELEAEERLSYSCEKVGLSKQS
jgi:preprotein translocase subunit SecA